MSIAFCSPRHRATTRRATPDAYQGHSPTGGAHCLSATPASPDVYPGITRGLPRHDPSSAPASPERSAATRLGAARNLIRSIRCGVHHSLGNVWSVVGVSPRVARGKSTSPLGLVWSLLRVGPRGAPRESASASVLVRTSEGDSPPIAQGSSGASSGQSDDHSGSVCDLLGVGPLISEGMSTPPMDILRDPDHLCLEIGPGESRPCSV